MKYQMTTVNKVQKASKKKPPAKRTELVVVMDKSSSMGRHQMTVLMGYNDFMKSQRDLMGECNISLWQFNDSVSQVISSLPVTRSENLQKGDFRPSGQTALYDAVGKSIKSTHITLQSRLMDDFTPTDVIFFIMTDGEENASSSYKLVDVVDMIRRFSKKFGWSFYFFGATKGAFVEGRKMGIDNDKLIHEGNIKITYERMTKIAHSHRIEWKGGDDAISL